MCFKTQAGCRRGAFVSSLAVFQLSRNFAILSNELFRKSFNSIQLLMYMYTFQDLFSLFFLVGITFVWSSLYLL